MELKTKLLFVLIAICFFFLGNLFFYYQISAELPNTNNAKWFSIDVANSGEPYFMCDKITRLWANQWDCETKSVYNKSGIEHILISYSESTVNVINQDYNKYCLENKYEMICK